MTVCPKPSPWKVQEPEDDYSDIINDNWGMPSPPEPPKTEPPKKEIVVPQELVDQFRGLQTTVEPSPFTQEDIERARAKAEQDRYLRQIKQLMTEYDQYVRTKRSLRENADIYTPLQFLQRYRPEWNTSGLVSLLQSGMPTASSPKPCPTSPPPNSAGSPTAWNRATTRKPAIPPV